MHWIREAGHEVSDAPEANELPEITDLDELQTFVGNKRHKIWIWTAVNHKLSGILAWVIGDPPCEDLPVLVEHRPLLAMFLVCHGWLVGISDVH